MTDWATRWTFSGHLLNLVIRCKFCFYFSDNVALIAGVIACVMLLIAIVAKVSCITFTLGTERNYMQLHFSGKRMEAQELALMQAQKEIEAKIEAQKPKSVHPLLDLANSEDAKNQVQLEKRETERVAIFRQ